MAKAFRAYEDQLAHLKAKGLAVPNEDAAKDALRDIGYFALVNGYKDLLRDPMTRTYRPGSSFDDVVAIFEFDDALRNLLLNSLAAVERKLRSTVSYAFCERHGEAQAAYLNTTSYNPADRHAPKVARLVGILDKLANRSMDQGYLVHYRKCHGNVPLWVLVNAVTFGQMSTMFSLMLPGDRAAVAKQFEHVNERELEQILKVLVLYRNVCAHGERLLSYRTNVALPDLPLLGKMGVPKRGTQYSMGKRDLFGVVVALRHLMPPAKFRAFKQRLGSLVERFLHDNESVGRKELFAHMGFPENWKDVTRYRL